MMSHVRTQAGDTLVEVAFALAILATILTSAFNLGGLSYRVGSSSRERTEAVSVAQRQAEMLRQFRDVEQAKDVPVNYPITSTAPCPAPISNPCWHMEPTAPTITAVAGTSTDGRYQYGITSAAAPGGLPLIDYTITVSWVPAIGNSIAPDNIVVVKLALADRKNFSIKPCEDATTLTCSNIVQ